MVAANLAKSVYRDSVHMDIGVLGARTILNALSDNGYAEIAYNLATKRTYPSWGYWMDQGLTSLPEGWDSHAGISLNHIFLGGISGWFYQGLGGIFPDEKQPGFKHILLRPNVVSGLDSFWAEHESPYGKIVSGWKTENGVVYYKAEIPPNSTADLQLTLHGKMVKICKLRPGTYIGKFNLKQAE
jgi:alpha-L-rhamnosidase